MYAIIKYVRCLNKCKLIHVIVNKYLYFILSIIFSTMYLVK